MVMGPTHSMSGVTAGAATIAIAGAMGQSISAPEALITVGITAGAALLPDIDAPTGTLSRSFGPITKVLSKATNKASAGIVNMTGTKQDGTCSNGHRKFTHTLLFCALISVATYFGIQYGGNIAALGIFFFLTTLALRGVFAKWSKKQGTIPVLLAAAGLTAVAGTLVMETLSPVLLATCVAVGTVTHLLGDAITVSGVPVAAPFVKIKGKRWYDLHIIPSALQIRAGKKADDVLLVIFAIVAAGILIYAGYAGYVVF